MGDFNLHNIISNNVDSLAVVKSKRVKPKKITVLLWLVVFVLMLTVVYMLYIKLSEILGLGENRIKNIPIVYTTNGKLLYTNPLLERSIIIENDLSWGVFSNLSNSARLNENGRYLAYLNNSTNTEGTLYLKNMTTLPFAEYISSSIKIDDNVLHDSFKFMSNSKNLVYLKSDETLNIWDTKKTYKIAENVKKFISVDKKNNIYFLTDKDNTTLKTVNTKDLSNVSTVSNTVKEIYKVYGDGTVVYMEKDENNMYNLMYHGNNKKGILAENCETVLDISKDGNVFFIRALKSIFDTSNLFIDTNKISDSTLEKPSENKYTTHEIDSFGKIVTKFNESEYLADMKKYEEKLKRDIIRLSLSKDIRVIDTKALVFKTPKNETVINNINSVLGVDAELGEVAYEKLVFSPKTKYDISKINPIDNGYEIISNEISNRENYSKTINLWNSKNKQTTKIKHEDLQRIYFTKDKSSLYTVDENSTLLYMPIEQDSIQTVGENIIYFDTINNKNIGIKYSDNTYELFKADKEIYTVLHSSNLPFMIKGIYNDLIFIYSEYDSVNSIGNLMIYDNKLKKMSENVFSYSARTNDTMYILKNYDVVNGGELFLYNSGIWNKIADNVSGILTDTRWGFGV